METTANAALLMVILSNLFELFFKLIVFINIFRTRRKRIQILGFVVYVG